MSEEQPQSSAQNVQENKGSAPESDVVSKKAYSQVQQDMHKFKAEKKELQMKLNELQATLEAQEKSKLEEQNRYEELYRKAEDEKNALLSERQREKQLFIDAVKKSALKTELGGNIKDAYLNLADYSQIEMNEDGSLNSETVRNAANQFRQDHPALVPSQASGAINSVAPPTNPGIQNQPKGAADMSREEKIQKLLEIRQQKLKNQGV